MPIFALHGIISGSGTIDSLSAEDHNIKGKELLGFVILGGNTRGYIQVNLLVDGLRIFENKGTRLRGYDTGIMLPTKLRKPIQRRVSFVSEQYWDPMAGIPDELKGKRYLEAWVIIG